MSVKRRISWWWWAHDNRSDFCCGNGSPSFSLSCIGVRQWQFVRPLVCVLVIVLSACLLPLGTAHHRNSISDPGACCGGSNEVVSGTHASVWTDASSSGIWHVGPDDYQTNEPVPVGDYPYGLAYDPVNQELYVTNFGSNDISIINTTSNSVVSTIPMPYGIEQIVADSTTGNVFVGDATSTIFEISGFSDKVVANITPVQGDAPQVDAYDPANGDLYALEIFSNVVSVINASQFALVSTIGVGTAPNGAVYDPANGNIYVVNEGSSNLSTISGETNRVVGQVSKVNPGPGATYATSSGDLYICSNAAGDDRYNNVTVVNGSLNKIVTSISIDSGCGGAVYDSLNGYVYVTDRMNTRGQDISNVTIIDPSTNRIVLTQPVQLGPIGIAYDSANHNLYVADSDTNNISILPQIYRLTLHETGLPAGTNWSATVEGTTFSSTTPSITFPEANGTFGFTIGNVASRSASPSSGTVTVANGPQMLNVTFSNSTGGGSGLFGLPGATGYYVLGGFVALFVAAVAVFIVLTRRKRRAKPSPTTPPPDGATGQVR